MAFHNDHVYMNFTIKLIRDSRMQSEEKIMWLFITKFHLLVLSLSLWLTLRSRHCYCLVCDILVVWPYTIKFALVQVSCFYYIPVVVQLLPLIPEHLISPVNHIYFIHSSVGRKLSFIHILAVMNNAVYVLIFVWTHTYTSPGLYV